MTRTQTKAEHGLLPTPPMPPGLPHIQLSENSQAVLERRYLRRGEDGKPVETVGEMFWRVAYHIAKAEEAWGGDVIELAKTFYRLMVEKRFFPNSPTFTGAGTPLGQLAACFVLPISDDMGRNESGIFQTLRNAALIQQTGGGNGFAFSRLRPKGALVKSSAGQATGPVGFLRVFDHAFDEIAQGGTRRGANMGVLRVDHPDVEEFITCKTDENAITNFNISVGITDAFMKAVEEDGDWDLVFPDVNDPRYRDFDGTLEQAVEQGIPLKVYKTVKARDLFEKIVKQAHHNGEPGLLFLDAANRDNPVPHLYPLESTNPCFVGSTRIATARGLIPIEELAQSGESVDIVTDNRAPMGGYGECRREVGTTIRRKARAFKTRSNAPVFRINTRWGYHVVATEDHPFLTPDRGYVPLEDLRPGDRILLQSGEGGWSQDDRLPNVEQMRQAVGEMALAGDHRSGRLVQRRDFVGQYHNLPQTWSRKLGIVLGYLIGDGWLSPNSNAPIGWALQTKDELELVHEWLQQWFGEGHVADRGSHFQLTYGRVPYEFFASLGVSAVKSPEKRVPNAIWYAPRQAVIGFLQGLFGADGSVQISLAKKDATVRLASSSRGLLEDVQLLLLNFGIVARILSRRKAGFSLLPDGHGGMRSYRVKEQYELIIGRENRNRFAEKIGFACVAKQEKLQAYLQQMPRGAYQERFEDQVVSIEPAGYADVYDLTEQETHSLVANGLVCHNCGEQWLGPYENCCLGSVNLAQHATAEGGVDWEKLAESVRTATRFLDDVVEANAYIPAVPQVREAAMRARRIGLGIMGLADLMYRAGVRYGSPEGQEFAAQVMEFVRYHAMQTSIELARERGPFPAIKGSIYDPEDLKWQPPQSIVPYERDWGRPPLDWDAIVQGIRTHGIRNAAQTTIAPTGCVVPGTMVSTDRGLLPIEALGNTRGTQWQEIDLIVASEDGERKADRFYINGRAHTLRVVTRRGYAIQGTDGHRIRVFSNGQMVWKRLDELQPGMKVALQRPRLIGAPREVRLDAAQVTDFHATPVTLPEAMTLELAYLLGVFMGGGSLKKGSLRFSLSDERLQARVTGLLQKLFGVDVKVQTDGRAAGLVSLEVHSRNLVAYWKRNGFAKRHPSAEHVGKGYLPHIPLAVLQTNHEETYAAFLAGLFDADGYLHAGSLPVWVSANRNFHDQVKTMLLALGVLTTSDVQRTGFSKAALYRLRASHAQAAEQFQRKLGQYLVRFAVQSNTRRKTLKDRIPILEREYRAALELADMPRERARVYGWRRQDFQVSRASLQGFVERHRAALADAGLARWEEIIEDDIFFDEIQVVEDGGVVETYDLSVPGTHAYIANGLISHNTIATVSGCEGYGCEPVFALAYIRHVNDNGKDLQLTYASPLFEEALKRSGLDAEQRKAIYDEVMRTGTCQHIEAVPEEIRRVFVVAGDISAEEHVRMQAAMQAFVDNSISKCVVGDTLISTPDGLTPIASVQDFRLPDQFAPLDLPILAPKGMKKADAFYYGGYRETRKISLEYGFGLEGTPNHRIHVLDKNGQVVFRRLDDLKIGDIVVLYSGQRAFGRPAKKLPEFSGAFRTSSNHIEFPARMSEEFAFFLGAVTSEGAITDNGVNISSVDVSLLEDLKRIALDLFGLNGYISKDPRNDVHYLQLNSRPLRHWLLHDLGLLAGAENKIIPTCILQASEDEQAAFLRGLFLDAYMTQNGKTFGITVASKKLIQQLQILFLNAGILAVVGQSAERAWRLTVHGGELERLASWISFVEVWKNQRLKWVNLNRLQKMRNYSRLLPVEITEALQAMRSNMRVSMRASYNVEQNVSEAKAYQRVRVNLYKGHRFDRRDAYRLYQALKREGASHPFADAFFASDDENRVYVRVQAIESGFAEVFDISVPQGHEFIANGMCNHNTVNFPATATEEDVATAYKLAWELGCKGITVYVTGSREKVVLETPAASQKEGEKQPPTMWHEKKKARPRALIGATYSINTPLGKAFITVNENGGRQPFEVFINTSKAGSETAAVSEAIGRLISYILRLASPIEPRERLREIVRQLLGIGGGRPLGFGPNRVRSLPDGVGQVLDEYLREGFSLPDAPEERVVRGNGHHSEAVAAGAEAVSQIGDLCPECGEAALVNEEGCRKCYACGYSEC